MSTPRILIVEDDPICAELSRVALVRAGYKVDVVHDAAALAVALSRERPDLILLDLHLPVMDGLQILRALKSDAGFCRIPVVACSAADDDDATAALACGCAGFIAKSVDARTLQSTVSWFFDVPRFPFRPVAARDSFRFPASAGSAQAAPASH